MPNSSKYLKGGNKRGNSTKGNSSNPPSSSSSSRKGATSPNTVPDYLAWLKSM